MNLFNILRKGKEESVVEKNTSKQQNEQQNVNVEPNVQKEKAGTTKSIVHNLIVLDESGSMSSIAGATVSGLKELAHTIRQGQIDFPQQQHFITLYSFEGGKINKRLEFKKVDEIDLNNFIHFSPGGMTNLYDAMGTGINDMEKHIGKDDVLTDVMVTIITDGEENASREFTYKQIQSKIADCKSKGWIFSYIGTDHDVKQVSINLGIQNVQIFSKNEEDMQRMWEQERMARGRHFQSKNEYDNVSGAMDYEARIREKQEWAQCKNQRYYEQKDIYRFKQPHMKYFDSALEEIRNGQKVGHWMWYIFPQLEGLGYSHNSQYYGLRDIDEAREYMANPIFGADLVRISEELLNLSTNNAEEIFGHIDSLKLRSCMTLFSLLNINRVFQKVLDKYFGGQKDEKTLRMVNSQQ